MGLFSKISTKEKELSINEVIRKYCIERNFGQYCRDYKSVAREYYFHPNVNRETMKKCFGCDSDSEVLEILRKRISGYDGLWSTQLMLTQNSTKDYNIYIDLFMSWLGRMASVGKIGSGDIIEILSPVLATAFSFKGLKQDAIIIKDALFNQLFDDEGRVYFEDIFKKIIPVMFKKSDL